MFFGARVRSLAGLMGFGIKDWSFLGIFERFSGMHLLLAAASFDGEPSIGCICFWIVFWLCSSGERESSWKTAADTLMPDLVV